jgi:hypothetical protein
MRKLVVLFAALAACGANASGALISAFGTGPALAGGTITVTFAAGGSESAVILEDMVIGSGYAVVLDKFHFEVKGDTFYSPWKLTNLSKGDTIISAEFSLKGTRSLFDDDGPDTEFGGSGKKGAIALKGSAILKSAEFAPWPNAANKGDMFMAEFIEFAGIAAGVTAEWEDDTDVIVPEPATWTFVGMAGCAAIGLRRRRA